MLTSYIVIAGKEPVLGRDTHDILLEITYAYSLWDLAAVNTHFP